MKIKVNTKNAEETIQFAKKFATLLTPPCVIILEGDLSAGKTTFAKGFAEGLGIYENITSPTFTILNEYEFVKKKFNANSKNKIKPNVNSKNKIKPNVNSKNKIKPNVENETENLKLYHFDMYRLHDEDDAFALGFEEYFDLSKLNGFILVEWPDRIKNLLPEKCIVINFSNTGGNNRTILISGKEEIK